VAIASYKASGARASSKKPGARLHVEWTAILLVRRRSTSD
jgi:hypothetical protein